MNTGIAFWKQKGRPASNGGVAQLGEHLPCKQGVKSSNLSISISQADPKGCVRQKMYLENCILRYELHEMIEDHEMQRHQTKFPNTNTNDREIETLLRCDATQREQTVDCAKQRG